MSILFSRSSLTTDELVATLIHTTLPTILVEGKYDMTIQRICSRDIRKSLSFPILKPLFWRIKICGYLLLFQRLMPILSGQKDIA